RRRGRAPDVGALPRAAPADRRRRRGGRAPGRPLAPRRRFVLEPRADRPRPRALRPRPLLPRNRLVRGGRAWQARPGRVPGGVPPPRGRSHSRRGRRGQPCRDPVGQGGRDVCPRDPQPDLPPGRRGACQRRRRAEFALRPYAGGCGGLVAVSYSAVRPKRTHALWPPRPIAFESATSTWTRRAAFGT